MPKIIEGPIKVLQIIHNSGVTGPGRIVYGLAKCYDRDKFEFDMLCPEEGCLADDLRSLGVKIIPLETKYETGVLRMLRMLKKENYHVFNCQSGMLNTSSKIIGKLLGVPVIIFTEHQVASEHIWINSRIRLFAHSMFHVLSNMMVDRIITVSEYTRDSFIKRQGIAPEKVVTIYNGVDTGELIRETADKAMIRSKWAIPGNATVVGIIARLHEEKGHKTLVLAAKEVLKQIPDTIFLIVGEGEEKRNIEGLIRDIGAEKNFIMTGFQKDVYGLMDIMDIIAQPSLARTEAFGLSLVEAMAKKKPVIATDVKCFTEIITSGEDGILFPIEDHVKLAQNLILLINNVCLRERLGAAAQKKTVENYDIGIMTRKTEELYKKALASKGFYSKDDYLKKVSGDFMAYLDKEKGLSGGQKDGYRSSLEKYINFTRDRALDEKEAVEYLEREDCFIAETFLQFLEKNRISMDRISSFNNRIFKNAIRQSTVTSKDYDERIKAQSLQFQVDNYYDPKDPALKRRVDIVLSFIRPKEGERLLDVGCGVGTFAYHCAKKGARTAGVDYSKESIDVARRLSEKFGVSANIEFTRWDASDPLPYGDGYFDKAVSADFMEHIDDGQKEKVLSEILRVLKPGGILIVFTPNGIRESLSSIKALVSKLFGAYAPETRLHYGLTNRFRFEKMLKKRGLTFIRRFFDVTRPYLASIPFLKEALSLDILWVIKKGL